MTQQQTSSSSAAARPRRRLWLGLGAALLLAGAGAAWWFGFRAAPLAPPLPGNVEDPEVRQAIERARQGVVQQPTSAAAWGHLGMTLMAVQCEADADRCFEEAARLDPGDPRWPYYRGLNALDGDLDRGVLYLRQAEQAARKSAGSRPLVCLRLAEALLQREELDEAEKLFLDHLAGAPGDPRASFGLGLIALKRERDAAAADYLAAARFSPSARRRATAQLAYLARSRGDEAAAAAHEKALAGLPDDAPWPDPLLAQVYALEVGQRLRWRHLSQLEQQGNFAAAANASLEELKRQPTTDAHIHAGVNLGRLGDYDRALPLLREAVRTDPDNGKAHYALAMTLFTRAEKEWQKEPGSSRAAESYRDAIPAARRATELTPGYAQAYFIWGMSLRRLGRPAEALAPLRTGVAGRPEDFPLQLALGEALLEAGRDAEAATHLENARQLEPKDRRPIQALERLHQKKGG
jgi:tetratricopeptide (TPR) repeat protein